MMTATPIRRDHPAARVEDALRRALRAPLLRAGWRPRVIGHTGYGSPSWVRVFGRVLLGPVRRPDAAGGPTASGPAAGGPGREPDLQRGWRAFLTLPVPGCAVTVVIGDAEHAVRSDRSGYIDAVVPADLAPGWHTVLLELADAEPGTAPAVCRVRVADPAARTGVVSDIDDTVMVTWLPRPLLAAWNTFVLREPARAPVPGMADLLRSLQEDTPGGMVVYLSTGAWNVAPTLDRFLARHHFPPGPLLLTDWGPTPTGWFRDGAVHKRTQLERLAAELPSVRWLLVGDDGQHDPEIYGEFAADRPAAVRGVAIRELSATEQVLARGLGIAGPVDDEHAGARAPWVAGPDGWALDRRLRDRGLL